MAALSFAAVSIGQLAPESGTVVTVPLHQAEAHPSYPPRVSVSADGRYVAFVAAARLVPEDTNDRDDIYVLDRESGAVTLESQEATPVAADRPVISVMGRVVVYRTGSEVLMIRDRATGRVRPLQRGREPPDGSSRDPSITPDGRYVAFASSATNLTEGPDANGATEDVYVADAASMTFRRIASSGFSPAISDDGRFVAFSSPAPLAAAANGSRARINTSLYDLQTGVTADVSVSAGSGRPDGSSYSPAISGDGRYVAFVSDATNLIRRRDDNKFPDVYVRDTIAKVTELVSRTPSGRAGNGASRHPALSADGRIVIFQSDASDLTCGGRCGLRDINLVADIFRHDRGTGVTELISRGRTPWMEPSVGPAADRTGSVIAFASRHPLDRADDRHDYDLFVWARQADRDRAR